MGFQVWQSVCPLLKVMINFEYSINQIKTTNNKQNSGYVPSVQVLANCTGMEYSLFPAFDLILMVLFLFFVTFCVIVLNKKKRIKSKRISR